MQPVLKLFTTDQRYVSITFLSVGIVGIASMHSFAAGGSGFAIGGETFGDSMLRSEGDAFDRFIVRLQSSPALLSVSS